MFGRVSISVKGDPADGEYEACGNELGKKVETLLVKYTKQLNSAAHDGEFETLSSQLNNALAQMTKTCRKDFDKVFVKKYPDGCH